MKHPRMKHPRATGLGALLAALVLALLPLPRDPAAAAAEPDGSAVTQRGTKGPYDDFSDLEVTVHQTRNLRGQGLRVTWKGGTPTQGTATDYLQIMQCWGDDPAGPKREQCQYGASRIGPGNGNYGSFIGQRLIPVGSDPLETEYDEPIPYPGLPGQTTDPFVPFTPVSGAPTASLTDWTYFNPSDTNEEAFARTQVDGTGETAFNLQSTREAPHLGCGDPVGTGTAVRGRGCWLVVVPRGSHEPDGSTGNNLRPHTSPLSTSNWNRRMVFPLDFLPVGDACPTDKAERRITGSELVTDAVTSWQSALCAGGATRFTFTQRGEEQVRFGLLNPTTTSPGLGFTVAPVEGGEKAGFVHAPVAVSALTVGFYWEAEKIGLVKDLRLNPRLLAKLLTASYPYDVRFVTRATPAPDHLKDNPLSILRDPEFLDLNPQFRTFLQAPQNYPGGILLSAERSDVTRVVWNYVRADAAARDFLGGKADPWGMRSTPTSRNWTSPGTAPTNSRRPTPPSPNSPRPRDSPASPTASWNAPPTAPTSTTSRAGCAGAPTAPRTRWPPTPSPTSPSSSPAWSCPAPAGPTASPTPPPPPATSSRPPPCRTPTAPTSRPPPAPCSRRSDSSATRPSPGSSPPTRPARARAPTRSRSSPTPPPPTGCPPTSARTTRG